jgi:hypothetical protein
MRGGNGQPNLLGFAKRGRQPSRFADLAAGEDRQVTYDRDRPPKTSPTIDRIGLECDDIAAFCGAQDIEVAGGEQD